MNIQTVGSALKGQVIDKFFRLPIIVWDVFCKLTVLLIVFATGATMAFKYPDMMRVVLTPENMKLEDLGAIVLPLGGLYLAGSIVGAIPAMIAGGLPSQTKDQPPTP